MVCTPRAKEGDMCGGFTTPCNYNICLSTLKCVTSQGIPDAPGICMKPTLSVGEVCRIEDTNTWMVMDRSADCEEGTQCLMNADTKEWFCEKSIVTRCRSTSCGVGEKCIIEDDKVKCITPRVEGSCDLKVDDSVLCAAGGVCKEGFACTGCQQTCKCDDNGKKVCSKECRPTCEKIDDKIDCMAEPVSEWSALGCKVYSCFGFTKSPSIEEKKYCCEKTGRYCKEDEKDLFSCKSDPEEWSFSQRKWCCEVKQVGCPVAQYDCSLPDDLVQIAKSIDGTLQTVVDASMWEEEKAEYCCEKFQVGCPTDKDLFDCDWSHQTFAPWSEEQSEWCCIVKGERCPDMFEFDEDEEDDKREMCQTKKSERAEWDEETRMYCCLNEGCGCATEKYDCYGDSKLMSEWDDDQRKWCCSEENIACKVDCRVGSDLLSDDEKEGCCELKGLHCKDEQMDEQPTDEKKYKKSIRLSFKGSISKIMENPKRFLRKFRKTILRVTKGLKSSNLMIEYVGGLMKDNEIPPQEALSRWGTTIPTSWNSQLFAEEEESAASQRSVVTLGHGVSSKRGQQALRDEGSFIDFNIQDDDAAVVDLGSDLLASAIDESRVGGGLLRDNGDGSTVIIEPVGKGMEELPEPTNDDEDEESNAVLYGIIGAAAAVCLGGAIVALTIYKKKTNSHNHDREFLNVMEEAEPKDVHITRI
eukprot:TRINITY_DN181_c0_g1_i3.p1 TRINITY_DN181_c0_g1~~TRINITY_DN181_c0_g1_i3.p1  ORF type:complete len:696 (+),score=180.12 TRINITY_DN181_c0_g1_i3:562-2649(+)